MNVKRGIFRFWLAASIIWMAMVLVVFHIAVDNNHVADALPLALAAALIPPALLKIAFSVIGWIISGFIR
jgi:hypothetical protein